MLLKLSDMIIISVILTALLVWFIWKKIRVPITNKTQENEEAMSKRYQHVLSILEPYGFEWITQQAQVTMDIHVDRKPQQVIVDRKTLIVRKDGKYFAIKLKTGDLISKRVTTASLRQVLLELQISASVDGIILYDLEKDRYQMISYPIHEEKNYLVLYMVASLGLGFIICYILVLGGLL